MDFIQKRINDNYDKLINDGYEVVGVYLQGSQNYALEYEGSDIDCKAIILPKFEDFVLSKQQISTTLVLEDNSHIDLKDIRQMFLNFKKQNINFIEILFTKYKKINPKYESLIQPMFDNREKIAHYNMYATVNSISGMSREKYKALEHPYPATIDKIEKYGFCNKQLHHIIRLDEFIERYINGEKYEDCLISNQKKYLIKVKSLEGYKIISLEQARIIAKTYCEETNRKSKFFIEKNELFVDYEVETIMNDVITEIMKLNFKTELFQ